MAIARLLERQHRAEDISEEVQSQEGRVRGTGCDARMMSEMAGGRRLVREPEHRTIRRVRMMHGRDQLRASARLRTTARRHEGIPAGLETKIEG